MKILTLTVLMAGERGDEAFMGTSSYATLDACKTALLNSWDEECGFDMQGETDPEELADIPKRYNAIKESFIKFWDTPVLDKNDPDGFEWWCDGEGCFYLFRWVNVVG